MPEGEASCRLLAGFFQTDRRDLTACSYEICQGCCLSELPSATSLNPVLASQLLLATVTVIEEGGIPSCDLAKAEHLQNWALKNIAVVDDERKPPPSKKRDYLGACFYLGEHLGDRECQSCAGTVRQKEFACHHEDHESTVIRDCMKCVDYEPSLARARIKTWAVGVTTAPRREPNLPEMLSSLKKAGWGQARVFAEPGSGVVEEGGFTVTQRRDKMGAWPNFLLGLNELVLSQPHADAYFMVQDDAVFCGGLRKYLERELWQGEKVGVVSLHTPSHQTHDKRPGFFEADVGWNSWGAMAFIFSNASARALLRHPAVINHRNRGMGEGMQNVDSVVGHWCRLAGLPYYLHAPSLCEHIGLTTTLWSMDSLDGRRSSSDFPGEDVDISSWMKERLAEKEFEEPEKLVGDPTGAPRALRSNLALVAKGKEEDLEEFLESVEGQALAPDERWLLGQIESAPSGWNCPGGKASLQGVINRLTSEWILILASSEPLEEDFIRIPDDDQIGLVLREGYTLVRRSALIQAGGLDGDEFGEVIPKIRSLGWIVLDGEIEVLPLNPDELTLPEEISAQLNRELPKVEAEFIFLKGGEESADQKLKKFRELMGMGVRPGALTGKGDAKVKRVSLEGALIDNRALRECLPLRGEAGEWVSAEMQRRGFTLWGDEES